MQFKQYKKKLDYSYSIGVFPTIELLETRPESVIKVMVSSLGETNTGIQKLRELCQDKGVFFENADAQVKKISQSENNYAVGVFRKYMTALNDDENHLVLVNPSDMGNLGTICRTMLGFDLLNLAIIKPAADIFDPKAIRASMGAVFGLNVEYFESFADYQKRFSNNLYPFMTLGSKDINEIEFKSPFSLIFGNEGAGLDDTYQNLGTAVRIGQSDKIDSLNLGVSVGIGIYAAKSRSNI